MGTTGVPRRKRLLPLGKNGKNGGELTTTRGFIEDVLGIEWDYLPFGFFGTQLLNC